MEINYQKVEVILTKKVTELTVENARLQALLDDKIQDNTQLQTELNKLKENAEDK